MKKKIVFSLPLVFLMLILLIKCRAGVFYNQIIQEDSVLEVVQCLGYFGAAVLAMLGSLEFRKRNHNLLFVLYLVAGIGLALAGLEEISWGQRLFGWSTPAFFQSNNIQRELSLHNLMPVQHWLHRIYIMAGLGGCSAWILPVLFKKSRAMLRWIAPGPELCGYFLPVLLIYAYFDLLRGWLIHGLGLNFFRIGAFFIWRDQEPAELLLSLGVLLFFGANLRRLRAASGLPATAVPHPNRNH